MERWIIRASGGQDGIEDASDFVSGGDEPFGRAEFGTHASVVIAHGMFGVMAALGGHAQGMSDAVGGRPGLGGETLPRTGAIVGTKAKPRTKVLTARKRG